MKSNILTTIDEIRIISIFMLINILEGFFTVSILFFKNDKPVINTKKATRSADRYSILPYPMGWALVGLLLEALKPTRVTRLERLSLRLFAPSERKAIECDITPITILTKPKETLVTIPMLVALCIICPLLSLFCIRLF